MANVIAQSGRPAIIMAPNKTLAAQLYGEMKEFFPNMQGLIEKHDCESDLDFAELLIEKVDLALVPGSAFGAPGHLRLSYAASMETLEEAILRLRKMA